MRFQLHVSPVTTVVFEAGNDMKNLKLITLFVLAFAVGVFGGLAPAVAASNNFEVLTWNVLKKEPVEYRDPYYTGLLESYLVWADAFPASKTEGACFPEEVEYEEIVEATEEFLETTPLLWDDPVAGLTYASWIINWPCKKNPHN